MDWLAAILGLTGCFLVGQHCRYGWLCYAAASAITIHIGIHSGYLGMAAGGLGYLILEIRGWKKHSA